MDAGEDVQWLQLFARLAVELVGDNLQRKRVDLSGVQKGCVLLVGREGQSCETTVPMADGNGVAVTDTEARGFIEEITCERIVASEVRSPIEGMWLADAVEHDRIAGFITLIDVVPTPSVGIVGYEAKLPPGCRRDGDVSEVRKVHTTRDAK